MRVSQLLLPTVKEDPAGAEAVSHKLMVRAGLVRQLSAGIYVYLPAGWRVMRKIEQIIREEMDAIGCQEMLMPVMQPAEIWQESGRWDAIGGEMFRLKDRKGADMALAMTHEEVVTWLAAREVHSYKQLPQLWYHFQTKERDEARPKSGILRTREFIMKDSYSLDVSEEALQDSYRLHIGAYDRIYARCGVDCMMVEGDSGMMGGAVSHEYMAYADAGEDEIVFCRECGYASNVETAVAGADPEPPSSELEPHGAAEAPFARATGAPVDLLAAAELDTPGLQDHRAGRDLPRPAGARVHQGARGRSRGWGRGRRGRRSRRLRPRHGPGPRRPRARRAQAAQGARRRVPHGDRRRGARRPGRRARLRRPRAHAATGLRRRGSAPGPLRRRRQQGRLPPQRRDVSSRCRRPRSPTCATRARATRAGAAPASLRASVSSRSATSSSSGSQYSVPMGATFLDEDGKERPIVMGSYGIGLARIAAAAVEQHHDDNGICWPASIAPFLVHLVLVRASDETQRGLADDLYSQLSQAGVEVVYDDRDMSPGIKFKDADLLGCPVQVVVGKRAGEGFVELKERASGERRDVAVADLAAGLTEVLARA